MTFYLTKQGFCGKVGKTKFEGGKMRGKKWWLLLIFLVLALIVLASGNGEGAEIEGQVSSDTALTVVEPNQGDGITANESVSSDDGAGFEFTEPGVYTVTACLSDDGGKTVKVCDSATVVVYECHWMPIASDVGTPGTQYICYIYSAGKEIGSFVTDPQKAGEAVDKFFANLQ